MPKGRASCKTRLERSGFNGNPAISIQYGDEVTLPPPEIAEDPVACSVYETAVRALIDTGRFQQSDRYAIMRLAINQSICESLAKKMLAVEVTQQRQSGAASLSGPFQAWLKASDMAARCEKALGLSPTTRATQGVAPVDEADELQAFLRDQE
jgi:hypothetical protein